MDLWLALEHVQAGRAQLAGRRAAARRLVHDRAAAVLTRTAVGFMRPAARPDQAPVAGDSPVWTVTKSASASRSSSSRQATRGRPRRRAAAGSRRCRARHGETGGPPGHARPIRPRPITPRVLLWTSNPRWNSGPRSRAARPAGTGPPRRPAGAEAQQRPGQVGGGLGDDVGGLAASTPGRAGVEVEVVVADGVVGHHPQPGAGPVQQLAVDPVGQHGHQPGLARDLVQQLGPGHDPLSLPDLERQRPLRCARTCSGTPRVTSTAGMPGIRAGGDSRARSTATRPRRPRARPLGVAGGAAGGLLEGDPVGARRASSRAAACRRACRRRRAGRPGRRRPWPPGHAPALGPGADEGHAGGDRADLGAGQQGQLRVVLQVVDAGADPGGHGQPEHGPAGGDAGGRGTDRLVPAGAAASLLALAGRGRAGWGAPRERTRTRRRARWRSWSWSFANGKWDRGDAGRI